MKKLSLKKFLKNPQSSRMFNFITVTWNPVVGCNHFCTYCWARRFALTKLSNSHRYKDGFKPKIIESEFRKKFRKEEFVFVSDMGDLFGDWVPRNWIEKVLNYIRRYPYTFFLLLTKNPKRYLEFLDIIPSNCILGTTIETDLDVIDGIPYSRISKAPPPSERIKTMEKIRKNWKGYTMIAIEPIMDFDLENFSKIIERILPDFVVIGKDNYNNHLPEPDDEKLRKFITRVDMITHVILKKSLEKFKPKKKQIHTIQDIHPKLEFLALDSTLSRLTEVAPKKFNEFHKWTPLKLVSLLYLMKSYLKIVHKRLKEKYGTQLVYLDLFAGSGLNKVNSHIILGSPLLSIKICKNAGRWFDKFYFFEKDLLYHRALKNRLKILQSIDGFEDLNYEVIHGDVNSKIDAIIPELKAHKHINMFVFIDPYKWEIKWETLEKLFKLKGQGDFLITHNSRMIVKEIGKYNKNKKSLRKTTVKEISEYFGENPDVWSKLITEDKVKEFYIKKLRKYVRYVETIHIKSGGAFSYYVIFCSKYKKSNPPWWNLIMKLKELIESYSGDIVKVSFDITTGRTKTLLSFLKNKKRRKGLLEFLPKG